MVDARCLKKEAASVAPEPRGNALGFSCFRVVQKMYDLLLTLAEAFQLFDNKAFHELSVIVLGH